MPTTLGTNLYQLLLPVASINGNSDIVANNTRIARYNNGNPVSWRKNINSPLSSLAANDLVAMTASTVTSALDSILGPANTAVTGGGSAGPLVDIPVTAGQTVLTVTGVVLDNSTPIYRNGGVIPQAARTITSGGGNSTITLAAGVIPVTIEEQNDPHSWQYQSIN